MNIFRSMIRALWPMTPYLLACLTTTAYFFLPLIQAWWCSVTTGGDMFSEGGPACGNSIWMFIVTVPTTPVVFFGCLAIAYLIKRFIPIWDMSPTAPTENLEE